MTFPVEPRPNARAVVDDPARHAEPRFVVIARILRPQGRRGEVLAEILTDFPGRFAGLRRVFLSAAGAESGKEPPRAVELESAWLHKGKVVLKLGGADSITAADGLRGLSVLIPYSERVQLPLHSYYWPEIEGCRVLAGPPEARVEIGTVEAIEPTAGAPILHVRPKDERDDEVLIPFAQEICREIDPKAKLILIDPPDDLLDLNKPSRAGQG